MIIKSNNENVYINADGAGSKVIFQTNGVDIGSSNEASVRNTVLNNENAVTQLPTEATRGGFSSTIWTGNAQVDRVVNLNIDMSTGDNGGLFWVKQRDGTNPHGLFDTVRGAGQHLHSDATTAEVSRTSAHTSFTSTGVTISSSGHSNQVANTYVGWTFGTTHKVTGTTNHGQAYTSHYNPKTGFSINGWAGDATPNHAIPNHLDKPLELSIVKSRTSIRQWIVGSSYLPENDYLLLDTNASSGTLADLRQIFTEDSTVLTNNAALNANTEDFIQYGFHSVPGYCKIGTYNPSGVAGFEEDCGFKVGWLMIKRIDGTGEWNIADVTRGGTQTLYGDLPNAENAGAVPIIFTDTGFILGGVHTAWNAVGSEYLYMAIADTSTDATHSQADYTYSTNEAEVSIATDTRVSVANGFGTSGAVDTIYTVPAATTYTVPTLAANNDTDIYLAIDETGILSQSYNAPLSGKSRLLADDWGTEHASGFRTTDVHSGFQSNTGVASASANLTTAYAWHAFDGSGHQDDSWIVTTTTTSWLQYSYSEPRILDSWRIRTGNTLGRTPERFTIEGSNDGVAWTAIDSTYTASDFPEAPIAVFSDFQITGNAVAYKYVRINITSNGGAATYTQIATMEFNTSAPKGDFYNVETGITVEGYGPNLAPTLANSADWTVANGVTVTGSEAVFTGGSAQLQSNPTVLVKAGQRFKVTTTISEQTSGNLYTSIATGLNVFYQGVGEHVFEDTALVDGFIYHSTGDFIGKVSSIVIEMLDSPVQRVPLAKLRTNTDGGVSSIENYGPKASVLDLDVIGMFKTKSNVKIVDFGVVNTNNRYVIENPFGDANWTGCTAEAWLLSGGVWFRTGFMSITGGYRGTQGYATAEGIVVQTGASHVANSTAANILSSYGLSGVISSAPCQVIVTYMGDATNA